MVKEIHNILNKFPDAYRFITIIHDVSHVWDDLIDKDKPVTDDHINKTFRSLLIDLPRNRFYQTHFNELQPIVTNSVLQYLTSVEYEKTNDKEGLEIGNIIRYSPANIVAHTLYICIGDKALELLPELYKDSMKLRHDEYTQTDK